MRKSRVLLAGVAVAAAAAGTTAFTAANTVPPSVAGYGQNTVSGATVTGIHYVPNATDASLLDAVEFTTSTNVTAAPTKTLVLRSGVNADGTGGVDLGDPYTCTVKTAWVGDGGDPEVGSMVLTCDTTSDNPAFTAFNGLGLTVMQ
jgi:hypothetical protein